MATITYTKTSTFSNEASTTPKISKMTISGTSYDVVDSAVRTAYKSDMAKIVTDLGSLNTDIGNISNTIGTSSDGSSASTLYGLLKKNSEDVATAQSTANEAKTAVTAAYKYAGSVANTAEMEKIGKDGNDYYKINDDGTVSVSTTAADGYTKVEVGTILNTVASGMNYAWDGTGWDGLGGTAIDTSSLAAKSEAYKAETTVNSESDGTYTLSMSTLA